ncbi:hypothetical protein EVAR_103873_1 [Eumeta japonica]|uniref:Uncharacterized protein n=1 Tax=Eumeta variegata TaxID=151549 RepID=A0A4C1SQC7_EUMVA|nr:hypothetical protein EVAR_103873_1 [Eumeta japonica]
MYRLLEERGYSLRLDDLPRRRSVAALSCSGARRSIAAGVVVVPRDKSRKHTVNLIRAQLEPHQFTCRGITLKEVR